MNSSTARLLRAFAAVLLLLPFVPAVADNGPQLVFSNRSVEIDRITRGGTVYLFSTAREQIQYGQGHSIVRMFPLTDDDGDGVVRYESTRDIETNGVWIVIDETSGRFTVQRTPGSPKAVDLLPDSAVQHRNGDAEGTLELRVRSAWVLFVRPGEGTWTGLVLDGGKTDEDGSENGRILLPTGKLQHSKLKEKKAGRLGKDDGIFVIDWMSLRVSTVKVK